MRIKRRLLAAQHVHVQGSVYQRQNTSAPVVWGIMLDLRSIRPRGVIPSVVKSMQMFYIGTNIMTVTNLIRLGGAASQLAFGPTPIGLVPPNVPHAPLMAPPNPLPVGVRNTMAAQLGGNWGL